MPKENRESLMQLRLEKAKKNLDASVILLDADAYKDAANRSYYSIFNAMRAILALDCFDSKKHSGIISEFNKKYLKTELLPKELSKTISKAFEVRSNSDYNDYYVISKEDVAEQIDNARTFLSAVEKYIETM